jgi:hypothetical protein
MRDLYGDIVAKASAMKKERLAAERQKQTGVLQQADILTRAERDQIIMEELRNMTLKMKQLKESVLSYEAMVNQTLSQKEEKNQHEKRLHVDEPKRGSIENSGNVSNYHWRSHYKLLYWFEAQDDLTKLAFAIFFILIVCILLWYYLYFKEPLHRIGSVYLGTQNVDLKIDSLCNAFLSKYSNTGEFINTEDILQTLLHHEGLLAAYHNTSDPANARANVRYVQLKKQYIQDVETIMAYDYFNVNILKRPRQVAICKPIFIELRDRTNFNFNATDHNMEFNAFSENLRAEIPVQKLECSELGIGTIVDGVLYATTNEEAIIKSRLRNHKSYVDRFISVATIVRSTQSFPWAGDNLSNAMCAFVNRIVNNSTTGITPGEAMEHMQYFVASVLPHNLRNVVISCRDFAFHKTLTTDDEFILNDLLR